MQCQWKDKVLNVTSADFEHLALDIFHFQYQHNSVYREYVDTLHGPDLQVGSLADVPFLPIRFFKSHEVKSTEFDADVMFESSGTTGIISSRHYVKDSSLYEACFTRCFERFYGSPENWRIVGLLPSYLERKNSSLVYMVNELIGLSGNSSSGFYLNEFEQLRELLTDPAETEQKTLLIGVTVALLDFAESLSGSVDFKNTTVMETGGMKGRRKEMVREQVHDVLKTAFQVNAVHSEYGMTELLSQAYSSGNGIFECPPWMSVRIRDEEDPLTVRQQWPGSMATLSGAVNIIDLANIYSCSFIATDDIGKLHPDGKFEILGRMDNSDLRGCSMLVV